jgi:hypothetical protein
MHWRSIDFTAVVDSAVDEVVSDFVFSTIDDVVTAGTRVALSEHEAATAMANDAIVIAWVAQTTRPLRTGST